MNVVMKLLCKGGCDRKRKFHSSIMLKTDNMIKSKERKLDRIGASLPTLPHDNNETDEQRLKSVQ